MGRCHSKTWRKRERSKPTWEMSSATWKPKFRFFCVGSFFLVVFCWWCLVLILKNMLSWRYLIDWCFCLFFCYKVFDIWYFSLVKPPLPASICQSLLLALLRATWTSLKKRLEIWAKQCHRLVILQVVPVGSCLGDSGWLTMPPSLCGLYKTPIMW